MRRARVSTVAVAMVLLAACVAPADAAPATMRDVPPPWPAPRDAISYIDAARLPHVRLDATDNQRILDVAIRVRGQQAPLAAYIGIDRVRAVQAPVHTHDDSGQVWLEGPGTDQVTLASFFEVWGVRFTSRPDGTGCLGEACGALVVTADGARVAEPATLRLVDVQRRLDVAVD